MPDKNHSTNVPVLNCITDEYGERKKGKRPAAIDPRKIFIAVVILLLLAVLTAGLAYVRKAQRIIADKREPTVITYNDDSTSDGVAFGQKFSNDGVEREDSREAYYGYDEKILTKESKTSPKQSSSASESSKPASTQKQRSSTATSQESATYYQEEPSTRYTRPRHTIRPSAESREHRIDYTRYRGQ